MKRIKVIYIISDLDKSLAFEWISDRLDSSRFELGFIFLNPKESALEKIVQGRFKTYRITSTGKLGMLKGILKVRRILRKERPEAIHCHLRRANMIGLFAAYLSSVPKRIYTRHYSTFNHLYHPFSVQVDKVINWLSTDIVAISKNVAQVLIEKEHVQAEKVVPIPHGFDLDSFSTVNQKRVSALRKKWNIPQNGQVIGVIARFVNWKGIQFIIQAAAQLLQAGKPIFLVLANAHGPYEAQLNLLLKQIPKDRIKLIPFEHDLQALYQTFDYYVHTPIDPEVEAFGQTYVEALAAGVPSVFSLSGIAHEFIIHEENALVVPYQDSKSIKQALNRLIEDDTLSSSLREKGLESVQRFSLNSFISDLQELYED